VRKQLHIIAASNWFAVPICALLAIGVVCCIYVFEYYSGRGESFAWFDGTSAWPSIAIILFAALLSVHFIIKTHFDLGRNGAELTEEFGLKGAIPEETFFFGWEAPPSKLVITPASPLFPLWEVNIEKKIDIVALWQRYLRRGRFWTRVLRAAPMTVLYMLALSAILPLIGHFPPPPIRGHFSFPFLVAPTIFVFLILTFVVIDAILLHEGFLKQLVEKKTYWPDAAFERHEYRINPNRPSNENDLADYWDILLIASARKRSGTKSTILSSFCRS
jgi:hypothetical protein